MKSRLRRGRERLREGANERVAPQASLKSWQAWAKPSPQRQRQSRSSQMTTGIPAVSLPGLPGTMHAGRFVCVCGAECR